MIVIEFLFNRLEFQPIYQGKPENYPQSVKEHGENVKFVTSPEFHSEHG